MIKNIIFDLGNVIIGFNQTQIIDEFAQNNDEKTFIKKQILDSEEWKLLDLGKIVNDEAIARVQNRNNYSFAELTKKFWHEWYKSLPINQDTIKIAKTLKDNGYKVFVLSNMAIETYEYFKDIEFFSICDGIIISGYEKIKKPDTRIFDLILNRYNLNAEECLFIDDDDTNRSYETANKIGIHGRRVIPNSFEDIKKLLEEYKIEI